MKIKKDNIIKILDSIYDNAVDGLPGTLSIEEKAEEYLRNNKEEAIDSVIRWAVAKSTTAGFVSSVGGLITLPIAVPIGLASSLYVQMRMVAIIASICGHDVRADKFKTFIYCCLVGDVCTNILKDAGVKIGEKLTLKLIGSISGEVLFKINSLVGFRLFTKFGEKGVINLGKAVPFLGGLIGGAIDWYWCKKTGETAKKLFFKK